MIRLLVLIVGLGCFASAQAEIDVVDFQGNDIRLTTPARRIVSLAPHLTELVFAAGAGDRLVGAVEYSNYPEAANAVPRVGSFENIDLERVVTLRPDVILAWGSGNRSAHLTRLNTLGIPVYVNEPRELDDIARSLEDIGRLAGTDSFANEAATAYRQRLADLQGRYRHLPPVRVFYQVWHQPLMTISGAHPITKLIQVCGGENIFGSLPSLAPSVSIESVLARDPEVIVASGMDTARPEWLDMWKKWPSMTAIQRDNLFFIPPGPMQRSTPRLLDATSELCGQLELARQRRPVTENPSHAH